MSSHQQHEAHQQPHVPQQHEQHPHHHQPQPQPQHPPQQHPPQHQQQHQQPAEQHQQKAQHHHHQPEGAVAPNPPAPVAAVSPTGVVQAPAMITAADPAAAVTHLDAAAAASPRSEESASSPSLSVEEVAQRRVEQELVKDLERLLNSWSRTVGARAEQLDKRITTDAADFAAARAELGALYQLDEQRGKVARDKIAQAEADLVERKRLLALAWDDAQAMRGRPVHEQEQYVRGRLDGLEAAAREALRNAWLLDRLTVTHAAQVRSEPAVRLAAEADAHVKALNLLKGREKDVGVMNEKCDAMDSALSGHTTHANAAFESTRKIATGAEATVREWGDLHHEVTRRRAAALHHAMPHYAADTARHTQAVAAVEQDLHAWAALIASAGAHKRHDEQALEALTQQWATARVEDAATLEALQEQAKDTEWMPVLDRLREQLKPDRAAAADAASAAVARAARAVKALTAKLDESAAVLHGDIIAASTAQRAASEKIVNRLNDVILPQLRGLARVQAAPANRVTPLLPGARTKNSLYGTTFTFDMKTGTEPTPRPRRGSATNPPLQVARASSSSGAAAAALPPPLHRDDVALSAAIAAVRAQTDQQQQQILALRKCVRAADLLRNNGGAPSAGLNEKPIWLKKKAAEAVAVAAE